MVASLHLKKGGAEFRAIELRASLYQKLHKRGRVGAATSQLPDSRRGPKPVAWALPERVRERGSNHGTKIG